MKHKIISAVLALCLCTSSMPAVHAGQEVISPQADAVTETSVSELVPCDDTIPTPAQVYAAMIALKDQEAYKEGTTWTDDEPYSDTKGYYRWKGGPLGGANIVAVGCVAFAFILSDTAFGALPARMYTKFEFEDIKVGDILRVNNSTHTVIVLEVSDTGVILAEGNLSGKVHWGRAMSKYEVMTNTSQYITRYPENYIPPNDPDANVSVDSGSLTGGLTWNLTKAGTLTISGNGAMPADFSGPSDQPWNKYSDQIRKIMIADGVTSIGPSAFYGNAALSVEIADTVTTIGNHAFHGCSLLYASIPSGVETIGDDAFRECPNLSSVTVSEGVKTIGERAFRGCESLTSVDLPASVTNMGAGAFYDCTKLFSVTFASGSNKVTMGADLFARCWNLMDITLPESIDCISERMFQGCLMLPGLIIPEGAVKIGESAFSSCGGFSAVYIPKCVTDIETGAFSGCTLSNVYYAGTEEEWGNVWKANNVSQALASATMHYNYIPESSPTPTPTAEPTQEPDATTAPTREPGTTTAPTREPDPTTAPTREPGTTTAPTREPDATTAPTREPNPTTVPTGEPVQTAAPTEEPVQTTAPTEEPAQTPVPTGEPVQTATPTGEPSTTTAPTEQPDQTMPPAAEPTAVPPVEETPAPDSKDNLTYIDGNYYFYEDGEMATSKEAFVDGEWRWFDEDGTMAVNKDVYQTSDGGKWVRYNENGEMVRGEDYRYGEWYYFEPITGAMAKGPAVLEDGRQVYYDTVTGQMLKGEQTINGQTYYFDDVDGHMINGSNTNVWVQIDGKDFWYEDWQRQGCDSADDSYRGKEIYDPVSNAWYWLDSIQQGAKAVSKDVYQESYSAYPDREDGTGKWVRYDENGRMVKGWDYTEAGTYYFEEVTGAMAKGHAVIEGEEYYFDPVTGIRQDS